MSYFKTLFAENGDKKEIPKTASDGKVSWEGGYGIKYAVTEEIIDDKNNVEREHINFIFNKLTELNNQLVTYDKSLYQQQEIKNIGQLIYDDELKVSVSDYEALDLTKRKDSNEDEVDIHELAQDIANKIGINGLVIFNDFGKKYFDKKISQFGKANNPWVDVTTGRGYIGKAYNNLFLKCHKTPNKREVSKIPSHNHEFECSEDGSHVHAEFPKVIIYDVQSEDIRAYNEKSDKTPPFLWKHNHTVTSKKNVSKESHIGEYTRPKNAAFFARMFLVEEDEQGSTVPAIEKIIRAL